MLTLAVLARSTVASARRSAVYASCRSRRAALARLARQVTILAIFTDEDKATSLANSGIIKLGDGAQRFLLC